MLISENVMKARNTRYYAEHAPGREKRINGCRFALDVAQTLVEDIRNRETHVHREWWVTPEARETLSSRGSLSMTLSFTQRKPHVFFQSPALSSARTPSSTLPPFLGMRCIRRVMNETANT